MFIIENLLSLQEVDAIAEALEIASFEVDASNSDAPASLQRVSNQPLQLDEELIGKLAHNSVFKNRVFPKRLSVPDFIRFDKDDYLKQHLEPVILYGDQILRRDCQVIVFLSNPDTYEGGEVRTQSREGYNTFKLSAGSAVVMESFVATEVSKVTSGVCNLASIICESLIRDSAMRSIASSFSDLAQSLSDKGDDELHLKAELALNSLLQHVVET